MSVLDLIGTVSGAGTAAEAITQAHLDWEVTKERLKHPVTGEDGEGCAYATMRGDNLRILKWGVSKGYHIIQNRVAFDLVDNLVHTMGCRILGAGEWRGGRRVFLRVGTGELVEIPGAGSVRLELLFQNSHDTSMGQRCNMVVEDATSGAVLPPHRLSLARAFSWRHTAAAEGLMAEATGVFSKMVANFRLCAGAYTRIAAHRLDLDESSRILHRIYPRPEDGTDDPNQVHRQGVGEVFAARAGTTGYDMLVSVCHYIDAVQDRRRVSGVNRARSAVLGPGLKLKHLAFSEIEDLVDAGTSQIHANG